jgi:hypothetical protein
MQPPKKLSVVKRLPEPGYYARPDITLLLGVWCPLTGIVIGFVIRVRRPVAPTFDCLLLSPCRFSKRTQSKRTNAFTRQTGLSVATAVRPGKQTDVIARAGQVGFVFEIRNGDQARFRSACQFRSCAADRFSILSSSRWSNEFSSEDTILLGLVIFAPRN